MILLVFLTLFLNVYRYIVANGGGAAGRTNPFFFLTASACTAVGLSEDGTEAFVFLYSVLPIWGRVSVAVPF